MKNKRIIALLLSIPLLLCLPGASARAAEEAGCTVIGADLTEEQIRDVYAVFGVERGSVPEYVLTNAEERELLGESVEDGQLGSASLSCVYFRRLEEGSGLELELHNITWCTEDMYRTAMLSAGIGDARAVIAAPCPVSGTAALAGIFKAYEALSGESLSDEAKELGGQELTALAQLGDQLGTDQLTTLMEKLKALLEETESLSDDDLSERIRSAAREHHIILNDYQTGQLLMLCRQLEKLKNGSLAGYLQTWKETLEENGGLEEKAKEAEEAVKGFAETLKAFFARAAEFISRLFEKE